MKKRLHEDKSGGKQYVAKCISDIIKSSADAHLQVRKLPPTLSEEEFLAAVGKILESLPYDFFSFYQGKLRLAFISRSDL
jgi:hypothetical protein